MDYSYIDSNLSRVRADLKAACEAGGHDPNGVILMAAIKSADVGEINYLHTALGVTHVGENRVQQLLERYDKLDVCVSFLNCFGYHGLDFKKITLRDTHR